MSEKKDAVAGYKVVLKSADKKEKTVFIKEMKIKFQQLAMKACGKQAGDNPIEVGSLYTTELLKILLLSIDGKTLTGPEKENLDDLFTYQEYLQLQKVINQVAGLDEGNSQASVETTFA